MKLLSKSLFTASAMLAVASPFIHLSAAPLPAPFDDLGKDFLVASVGAKFDYNSNVLSSPGGSTKFDDFIMTINPGIKLEYGTNTDNDVSMTYTETFLRYYRRPSLNEELSNVGLNYSRKQGEVDLTAGASYVQNYNNTPSAVSPTLSSIIRYDTIALNGNFTWNYSQVLNFGGGVGFSQNHYLYSVGQGFQDTDNYTLPVNAFYVFSPALSVGVGYTYAQSDPKNSTAPFAQGRERDSHTVSLNAKLTEWQKLSGSANVGVTENRIQGIAGSPALTTDTVSYGLSLDYAYSEKVMFSLDGNRGFNTGTQGQNIETTSLSLGSTFNYSPSLKFVANLLSYTYSQYLQNIPSRNDNTYTSGITVTWTPSWDWLTLSAGYTYFMNSSSAPNATYNINVITVSANIKY